MRPGLKISLLVITAVAVLSMGGCPVSNQTPVANAGADAVVATGANVTLNGTGSADADGDTLTFSWTQTSGTAVALTGATTATPSFTAPGAATVLTFTLTVNDGRGATATDSVNITVQPGGGGNHNPTASAGPDQNVAGGAAVSLTGSGSDADGDSLTFAWTQTAGANVTLTGANTANASFTAPQTSGTLTFQLTVSDGRGGTGTDSVNIVVKSPPVLFIANFTGNNVTSYKNPAAVNGNIAPDTNLAGAQTQLANPADIVIDANGALIASNFNAAAKSLTAYDNAAAANGNLAPNRDVQGGATGLNGNATLAINASDDLLFVGNITATAHISVFQGASTAGLNGNLAPIRTISGAPLSTPVGINLDGNDNLYVANNATGSILVYASASTLNGTAISPTRILTSAAFNNVFDVFIDAQDRMYVVNSTGGANPNQILTFSNASTLNGVVSPSFTLKVTGASVLSAIAVDSSNTGYIVDNGASAVYAYDNIATRNGALVPDRTISGSNTQLAGPIRVFLKE